MERSFNNSRPWEVVDDFFHRLCVQGGETCDKLMASLAHCIDVQFPGKNKFTIPSLNFKNPNDIEHGALVRFRCMIRDMFDPEMLPSCLRLTSGELKPVILRDTIDFVNSQEDNINFMDSDANSLIYRYVFKCIPIPGETFWFKHEMFKMENVSDPQDHSAGSSNADKVKRPSSLEDEILPEEDVSCCKRFRDDSVIIPESCYGGEAIHDGYLVKDLNSNPLTSTRKLCHISRIVKRDIDNFQCQIDRFEEILEVLNEDFPLEVYSGGDSFKLNDVVEFIGILSKNQVENGQESHSLHAIKAQLLSNLRPFRCTEHDRNEHEISRARKVALDYLKYSLFNDELAAEYLLCNLIASTVRKEMLLLAKFTLNLYNLDSSQADKICNALRLIVPRVQYLPFTLDIFNKESLVPRKDYQSNCLNAGRLQLASGTLLIVDETKLSSGQLNEQGVKNIAALRKLIGHQRLDYDFVYHGVEFPTDLNILVLSEGISCLSSDYALPLNASEVFPIPTFDIQSLHIIRQYLMSIRSTDFAIEGPVQEMIREDFVDMRRKESNVDQMTLHELLGLARWLTCSSHVKCLSKSTWTKVKDMEMERRARLKSHV